MHLNTIRLKLNFKIKIKFSLIYNWIKVLIASSHYWGPLIRIKPNFIQLKNANSELQRGFLLLQTNLVGSFSQWLQIFVLKALMILLWIWNKGIISWIHASKLIIVYRKIVCLHAQTCTTRGNNHVHSLNWLFWPKESHELI